MHSKCKIDTLTFSSRWLHCASLALSQMYQFFLTKLPMRPSIIRFAQQISASTGKPYNSTLSKKLEARGFQSPYWLTPTSLHFLGIGLCERDTKGSYKYRNLELLNADQTTDPEKVQKYAGRIEPRWAVTQRLIQATEVLLTYGADNLWLTKIEIERIGLNLTEGHSS